MLTEILSCYTISPGSVIKPFGTGLINRTWLVKDGAVEYILQKINQNVFKQPVNISDNIELIEQYLKENHPGYFFVAPLKTKDGKPFVRDSLNDYYRLFPFVKDSKTYDVVQNPQQAFEAARQFGLFTYVLSGLPLEKLKITLPAFHDLSLRYSQFANACREGNPLRIKQAKAEIEFIRENESIVETFKKIKSLASFKKRVTHHDTKISNILFNQDDKGICVIDLDTIMPGYFISDVGDMLRTYLSPVSEEEQDHSKIEIREEYFKAVFEGYLSQMKTEMTEDEVAHFVYAGEFMIYMQAIRFLTDYLNNDQYYGAAYEEHNFSRAKNQITLLKRLLEKKITLNQRIFNRPELFDT
jgi:thiamine kinase-like enzyme